ncbi:30S ribosomal protein S12 methylthiotransferase RimO [Gelria sp. Kuro-4]|uniref:30S ribosomal protein S12 methylthiotransferase RimO n=1 Tax=Gelria sp. Kuro-4 TaxID=2796927 RepID=UPI001BF1621F|nr:30S ribosomal protein S12 methylthiotransferase RimO [Gelria sp. Kuro-4]BCV25002.1 ribosomal protein S12 methylthiotransferase RimO [Gelria sp. Kuro-4]
MQKKKVGLVSLGCAKNLVDSEGLLAALVRSGYELTTSPAEAEIIIVNTCGFIEAAKEESIDTILEMATYKEKGRCRKLVVTGCLGQRYPQAIAREIPEVDAVLGTGALERLPQVLAQLETGRRVVAVEAPGGLTGGPRILATRPGTAYLKIAEGCNHRCSYCVIPQLRGPLRSRPEEEVVAEARSLARRGAKEIILVAQDTTSYGLDLYGEARLPALLKKLAACAEIEWLRLLYLYPERITSELLTTMAEEPKICRYFDIPLQHVNDRLLKAMGRASRQEQVVRLLAGIRDLLPEAALRTTFIVGFPGETEAEFAELVSFVRREKFDWVGAFAYSAEEGTPAAALPGQILEEEKTRRRDELLRVQRHISLERNRAWLGKKLAVLIEEAGEGRGRGRCFRQAPEVDGVTFVRGRGLRPGQFVQVTIDRAGLYDLGGRVENEPTQ